MKKLLFIYIFFMFLSNLSAQNLVPNPSFEDTIGSNPCNINYIVGWYTYSATVDYFNARCAFNSVPDNPPGYQYAATGNAYCGFYSIAFTENYREYIGRQLANPLIIGQKYYVSFKVVLVESAVCATANLGILFSTIPHIDSLPLDFNFGPTYNFAHVYTSNIITDTANWVTISGSFTADSAYQYIQIGNFFDDSNTDTLMIVSNPFCFSYYFVDDICVTVDSGNCDTITDIGEYDLINAINIYPNPANNELFIKLNTNQKISIKVYNLLGKLVYVSVEQQAQNNTYKVNLSNQPAGMYFVQVILDNKIKSKKIFLMK